MSFSTNERRVVVLGASSHIGEVLLPLLLDAGFAVLASTRAKSSDLAGPGKLEWIETPMSGELPPDARQNVFAVISLVPLSVVPPMIDGFARANVSRLIAFGSTNLFTKGRSNDAAERRLVDDLRRAEAQIARRCAQHGIAWTIFRPTLVYLWGRDKTVSEIGRFVQRFRIFPLLGRGTGLRQPVHAADLARACLAVLENEATYGKAYNLAGGRRLAYREMVEEAYRELELRPRFVSLPGWLIRGAIHCARLLPRYRHLSPELATRMDRDMCFDFDDAHRDFGFDPRPFRLPHADAGAPVEASSGSE